MERQHEPADAPVELGSVSRDTEGGMGEILEPVGMWHKMGISDD